MTAEIWWNHLTVLRAIFVTTSPLFLRVTLAAFAATLFTIGAQAQTIDTGLSAAWNKARHHHKRKPGADAERDWGNTGTDFNTAANWSATTGGVPPGTGDVGWFKAAVITQPNLSASLSIAGLYFNGTGSSGYSITATNSAVFTLTAVSGSSEISNGNSVAIRGDNTTGTNTISVPLILAPNSGTTSIFSQAGGGTLIVNGGISGSGIALNLNQLGSGTANIQLNGANSYSGTTTVANNVTATFGGSNSSAGATTVSGIAVLGPGTNGGLASGLLTIGGATVNASDNTSRTVSNALSLGASNLTFGATGTGSLVFNGDATLTGTSTWTTTSNTTLNGAISGGSNGITKRGSGTLTFGGSTANSYTGITTVGVGELDLAKTGGAIAVAGNVVIGDATGTDTLKLLSSDQIADTASIQIDGMSGVFNLNNFNETIGSLADRTGGTGANGSVQLGSGVLTINQTAGTAIFSGGITGSGSLVKDGAGTLVLNGANLFTGGVTINAGILAAGSATVLGPAANATLTFGANSTGKFQLNGNNATVIDLNTNVLVGSPIIENGSGAKTLTVNTVNTDTFAGVLQDGASGALALAKGGTGSLTLSGLNSYTGGTTLSAGTLNINNASAIGSGLLTVNGATIGNTSGNTITLSSGNNISLAAGTLTFAGPNDLSFGNNTVTMTGGNRTISVSGGDNLTIGGIAEDTPPRNFTKNGNGNLILIGTSTYTGTTTLSAGAMQLGNGGATGALSTGTAITDNANLAFNRSNAVVQGTDFTGAAIGGTGSISQLGTGSLTFNAANSYQGGTTLSAGTLNINNGSAIGTGKLTISGTSAVDNTSGSSITLSTNNAQAWNSNFTFLGSNDLNLGNGLVTLNGSQTITAGAGTLTEGGTIDINSTNMTTRTLTFNGAGNVTLNGPVQNSSAGSTGNLTYSGTGTLTLNGTNAYNGTTTLSSGTVAIGNDSAFGTSALAIAGGTLTAVGGPHSISNTTTLGAGNGTISGTNDLTFTGSFTEIGGDRTLAVNNTGTTTLNAVNLSGNNTAHSLTITGAGNVVLNGMIADGGTGAGSLIFDSGYTGTTTLNGANTYSGATTLTAGTFVMANKSSFGTSAVAWNGITASASTDLSGANAIANTGTLKNTNTFAGSNNIELSGTLTNIDNSGGIKNSMSAGTLTLSGTLNLSNNTNSRTMTFSGAGNTLVSGVIQDGGSTAENITKSQTGTLTVTNVDTYTGTTTINAGVFDINSNATTTGKLAGTSTIVLNSGTLMLSNTGASSSFDRINDSASLTMNGGTFKTSGLSEHGATNNTAGIGALTLQSSSVLNLGNGSSIIALANSSAQTWAGTLSIYNWTGLPTGGGTDQVYFGNDNTGLTAAQLADITFYSDSGVTALGIAQMLADGEIVPIAVPEPGTWVTGGMISLVLLVGMRRASQELGVTKLLTLRTRRARPSKRRFRRESNWRPEVRPCNLSVVRLTLLQVIWSTPSFRLPTSNLRRLRRRDFPFLLCCFYLTFSPYAL